MTDTINQQQETQEQNLTTKTPLQKPSLGIDVDYYQSIIDDPDVSMTRKRELIEIIGSIVLSFIDLGFGVHTVQLAQEEIHNSEKEKLLERSDI